ncbi:MAG: hypothetical protein ACOX1L_05675 [Erysipelotrichaceae bacterium]|jgi:hypothetical protein
MKRRVFVTSIIVILLSIGALSTHAYIVAQGTATNIITTGKVKIELKEYTLDENNKRIEYGNEPIAVIPSMQVDKIVNVKNVGNQPAYVRVSVKVLVNSQTQQNPDLSKIIIDYNQTDWTFKDGYWYYMAVLNAGETTKDLFTSVEFSANMGNEFMNSTVTVDIQAQATQFANQNVADATDAKGWPTD